MTALKQNTRLRSITMTDASAMAVLEDRKWQTRRLITDLTFAPTFIQLGVGGKSRYYANERHFLKGAAIDFCSYKPGDTLYIRETHFLFGHWEPIGITKTGKQKWKFVNFDEHKPGLEVLYLDSPPREYRISMDKENPQGKNWYKRNGRFMPKKYARTFVEVTGVKVEQLDEISEADAVAEGIKSHFDGILTRYADYEFPGEFRLIGAQLSFKSLWQSIHGPESWGDSWVFAVSYKLIK